jgi:hypothetical protein
MTTPDHRNDSIAETQKEILRIVIATAKELQAVVSVANSVNNINKSDDTYKKLVEIQDRLQLIADYVAGVLNRMQFLLRRNCKVDRLLRLVYIDSIISDEKLGGSFY